MADILTDFSKASMAHAVEANLFSFFQHIAIWPRVELHIDASLCWTLSYLPFPLFNSVVRARFDAGSADSGIAARMRACSDRHVPMLWWTGPSTTPEDLGERLAHHGFLVEPSIGMAADLERVLPAPANDPRISVEPVRDSDTLAIWCRVLCDSFGAPRSFGEAFADLATAVGLGPASAFRHFLGRLDGLPAATCSLFLGAGVAGIYDVGTLRERRRQGLGAAMTRAAMANARETGYRMAILHSSDLGANLYRSIGFEDVCDIGQYVWAPQRIRR